MSVRITSVEGAKLRLTGDVEAILDLPFRAAREGFTLAFSDGTLVRGDYDAMSDNCRFTPTVEGAGAVSLHRGEDGPGLEIGWRIDWIILASGDDTLCPSVDDGSDYDDQLTLHIGAGEPV